MNITDFNTQLAQIEQLINESQNVAIIHHANPDGDALGSSLSFYLMLKAMGKTAKVVSPTQFPDSLRWMPEANHIIVVGKKSDKHADIFVGVDLIICVDFNALSRIASVKDYFLQSNAKKILIDHHVAPEAFADVVISDTSRSSTAELIYDVIKATSLRQYLNTDIATCLYTGIMTDTGCFQYSSSQPYTFVVVSELLKMGIKKNRIYDNVFNCFSVSRMRLMGHVMLNRMVVVPELKTGYIYITAADRKNFNEKFGDTENFVNIPLSIKGVVFSAIFIERDNFVKISFRSKGDFDVNKFSQLYFNGGGHVNASGGESYDTLENTVSRFVGIINGEYRDILS